MGKDELTAALRAEFTDEVVKFDEDKRPYIPPEQVEQRLDEVVGPDSWTWAVTEVLWTTADGRVMNPNIGTTEPAAWVIARGRLTLHIDGRGTFRDGEGSARVMRSKDNRQLIVDPGDNLKGACSNAFKKAALRFGVGAYLRGDDVKARIQQGRSQAGRGRPGASGQAAPRQAQAQGDPQAREQTQSQPRQAPAEAAPADALKTVTAKIVQNPVRPAGGGRCQVVAEDNKGNRALLVAETRDTIAVLAEVKIGSAVRVRGLLDEGQNGLPELHISAIALSHEQRQGPPAAGGDSKAREFQVTLVGQIERSEDGKSARAIVAGSNGEKGVLVASKPGVVALLRAQKPGAKLTVVADVDRSGPQPQLLAQSIRPVVDRAVS